jgi:hypothetical protein
MRKYVTVIPSDAEISRAQKRNMEFSRISRAERFTSKISPDMFVRAWLSSRTIQEVADRLGMTYAAVGTRARKYIKQGVNLPFLQKKSRPDSPVIRRVPVNELNEMIELATQKKE